MNKYRFNFRTGLSLGSLLLVGGSALGQTYTVEPLGPISVQSDPLPAIRFFDATVSAGLTSTYTDGNGHDGGCAWVDYNGDLLPDLFVTNGAGYQHYLYRNDGGGQFTDVSSLVAKPNLMTESAGVIYADIENDGDYDLLVLGDNGAQVVMFMPVNPTPGDPNLLYLNNGDGTFSEVGSTYGVVHPLAKRTICGGFADYDLDGFVDLYLGSWTPYSLPLGIHDDYNRMLHNDGDGTFSDVTAALGVDGYGLDTLVSLWFDVDNDLYPDLYVGNSAFTHTPPTFDTTDTFYLNNAGTAFTDGAPSLPSMGLDDWAPMGMDVGDIDNDGDWDLYITDSYPTLPMPLGNVLYLGDSSGGFSANAAPAAGLAGETSWPCAFMDLDRDGWTDLWIGCLSDSDKDRVYWNRQDGTFTEIPIAGFQFAENRGGSYADYDGDGDLDLFAVNHLEDSKLYENRSFVKGGWIEFKLYGQSSNHGAIGAVVEIDTSGVRQMRRISGGDSAHSQSDAIVHFGTGDSATVDVKVKWPNGTMNIFQDMVPGDLYLLDESAGIVSEVVSAAGLTYDDTTDVLEVIVENNFGGRGNLSANGYGPLNYDAATLTYRGTFSGVTSAPANCQVDSTRGGSWTFVVN